MSNRNMTITLPEDLVRRAKVLAAQRDTSVSALVRDLLTEATGADQSEDRWSQEEALMRQGDLLRIGEVTWTRDELRQR
ncbi:MAG: DUF6364 family protein [Pauljensenia sp.]